MPITEITVTPVQLIPGDTMKRDIDSPWVEVIKWERDRFGIDVLVCPQNGNPPRWIGFVGNERVLVHRNV